MRDGETGTITGITGGRHMQCRLFTMGIRIGKRVTRISRQPLGGPVAIEIDNFCVALGRGMARRIILDCGEKADASTG